MKHSPIRKLAVAAILLSSACGGSLSQNAQASPQETSSADTTSVSTPVPPGNPGPPSPPPAGTMQGGGGGVIGGSGGGGGAGIGFGGAGGIAEAIPFPFRPFENDSRQGSLIVMTKDVPASTKTSSMTEDLSIMFRLLEKTMQSKMGEAGGAEAMNIRLVSFPGQNNIRNMYLQDYGALFFLKANMPLVRSEETKGSVKSKEDDAWEQTKRELDANRTSTPGDVLQQRYGFAHSDFNESKVAALKAAIIGNLKYASNIQWIKPEEFIVVVITGSPTDNGAPFIYRTAPNGPGAGMSEEMRKRYGLSPQPRLEGTIARSDSAASSTSDSEEETTTKTGAGMSEEMRKRYGLSPQPRLQGTIARSGSAASSTSDSEEEITGKTESRMSPVMQKRYDLKTKVKEKSNSLAGAKNQTLLVVRAVKADVDAFAAGKLSFDDFKGKVSVQSY